MKRLYVRLVSFLILALARYCLKRGRYVDYTHRGQVYLRRYGIFGHLTGDAPSGIRSYLPNLYLHQMINPDLDTCLHDHPWPWAVSWVALGGYREVRRYDLFVNGPGRTLTAPTLNFLRGDTFHRIAGLADGPGHGAGGRSVLAPLGGQANPHGEGTIGCSGGCLGTFTFFLAGPRRHAKPWGYLVPGQGYVSHRERHENFGGEEKRGLPVNV